MLNFTNLVYNFTEYLYEYTNSQESIKNINTKIEMVGKTSVLQFFLHEFKQILTLVFNKHFIG